MPTIASSPFTDRTPTNILAEMLAQLPTLGPSGQPLDVTPGSYIYDSLSAVAVGLAELYIRAQLLLDYSFIDTSYGAYLDSRAAEHGLTRNVAVAASGSLTVTGVQATTIPAGTQFSNLSDTAGNVQSFTSTITKQIQPREGNGTFQETDPAITYTGTWGSDATSKFSSVTNDKAEIFINGTSIAITFDTTTTKGIANLYVDDVLNSTQDTYAAAPGTVVKTISGMTNANHKIRVEVSGTKNGSSSGFTINLNQFVVSGSTSSQITDTVAVTVQAITPGSAGNVGTGTVTRLVSALNGITAVTNAAAMAGGKDTESDTDFKTRFFIYVANPPASGNKADYIRWAKEASTLVGNADVQPLWAGNGTVKVFVLDTLNNPAAQPILDAVQAYIDPLTGALTAPTAPTVVAGVAGTPNGTYKVQVTFLNFMGETNGGTEATVTVTNQKISWSNIPTGPAGTTGRRLYRTVASGATGTEQLVATIADNTTTTFTDNVADSALGGAIPTFNTTAQSVGSGKAPIGSTTTVVAPTTITIDVQATLTISTSYDATSVKTAINAALTAYIQSLPIAATIKYTDIANVIHDTGGVLDYTSLQIRKSAVAFGTTNISLNAGEKAVYNSGTWS